MKKINDKGFTLIELLAVIVIMGILMMVAIPAVSRTIENSRKDTFIDNAKAYANAVITLWTADGLVCGSDNIVSSATDDGDYYVRINTKGNVVKADGSGFDTGTEANIPTILEQGGKSSWGNRDVTGYVRVNIATNTGATGEDSKRVTKFYVALSDGTHAITTTTSDGTVDGAEKHKGAVESSKLVRGNLTMSGAKHIVTPTGTMCVEN